MNGQLGWGRVQRSQMRCRIQEIKTARSVDLADDRGKHQAFNDEGLRGKILFYLENVEARDRNTAVGWGKCSGRGYSSTEKIARIMVEVNTQGANLL